jgi:hypothetical protein
LKFLSDSGGIGHCLRRQNDKDAVVIGIAAYDLNRFREPVRFGIPKDIYRIASAPVGG